MNMVVLVVALSLETMVLVFRVSQEAPEQLPYVASVGVAAALPEAMQAAKKQDRKIEKSAKGEARP